MIREFLVVPEIAVVFGVLVFLVVLLLDAQNVAKVSSGKFPFFLLSLKTWLKFLFKLIMTT